MHTAHALHPLVASRLTALVRTCQVVALKTMRPGTHKPTFFQVSIIVLGGHRICVYTGWQHLHVVPGSVTCPGAFHSSRSCSSSDELQALSYEAPNPRHLNSPVSLAALRPLGPSRCSVFLPSTPLLYGADTKGQGQQSDCVSR